MVWLQFYYLRISMKPCISISLRFISIAGFALYSESKPSLFLCKHRQPLFVSECMASVFRAKKRASSFHCRCSLYVFNYFQRSVPPVHNIVSSLNLCFCWTVPQITFPFNSKNNFRESLLYPFAFNLKQINGSYSASGFLLISSELSYNLNYQASIL